MNLSSIWTDPLKRRWLGWGTLTAAFLLVSFHRVSTAVIAEELMRAFDTTGAQLGLLHASFFYIYALLQLPSGVVVDRMGTRRVATVGVVVMSAGVIGFSMSNSYLVGFLTRTLIGLGGSVMYIATLRFCANWYRT
ncbi:MAG: MFS transporter, partial [Halobacteria archaeon]|nr:MFS transporter [Halobacteria archaeon]